MWHAKQCEKSNCCPMPKLFEIIAGLAVVLAAVVFVSMMPEMVRYIRIRRM